MAPVGPPPAGAPAASRLHRAAWFLAYWLAGIAAVAAVAWGLRVVMGWAGLRL